MITNAQCASVICQNVPQPDCCTSKFKPVWKSSNCCANNQTTPHTIKQFAQQPVLRKLLCKQSNHTTHDQTVCTTVCIAQTVVQTNHTTHDPTVCTTACIAQTVVQTIKPHHTWSNNLHNSLYCANCSTMYGALKSLNTLHDHYSPIIISFNTIQSELMSSSLFKSWV